MTLGILRPVNQWLLSGLILLAPYFFIEANTEDLSLQDEKVSINHLEAKAPIWYAKNKKEELYYQTIRTFSKFTIDFHDYALSILWQTEGPTYPLSILETDIQNIAILLNKLSPQLDSAYLLNLTGDYLLAADRYVDAVVNGCLLPNNIAERASSWKEAGAELAAYLASNLNGNRASEDLQRLFLDWTQSQINFINYAAPLCLIPDFPASNAILASQAFAQARAFSYLIANQVFDLLSLPERGR